MVMPSHSDVTFHKKEFRTSLRWRLGERLHAPGMVCCHQFPNNEMCSFHLDPLGQHAVICGTGGLTIKRHDWIRDLLANACHTAQLDTLTEQIVPHLAKYDAETHAIKETRMDVIAWSPFPSVNLWLDVCIVLPTQKTLVAGAANNTGFAAQSVANHKYTKYGKRVTPCIVKTYGRLGTLFLLTLEKTRRPCAS
jgi:hypothetical protein